ncbi:MAG: K+-transporting ATPase, KdpA, partial [Gemmatimonadetes bacterium]|nr:K+-transporting ATPase, KdpA [Gemmatimonadota bacterium]
MTASDWIQLALYFAVLLALAFPLGRFMAHVMSGEQTWLTRLGRPLERGLYRLAGVADDDEMSWPRYATALLVFSAASFAVVYLLQRLQASLPANPAGFAGVSPALAFNTAVSFATNTNWQSYSGETTL